MHDKSEAGKMSVMTKEKLPREGGAIVYEWTDKPGKKKDTLYINTIPNYQCTNSCRFCGRKDAIAGKPNIYEQKAGGSLYLPQTPSVEDIIKELKPKLKKPALGIFGGTKDIAFAGLGEPLLEFELIRDAIAAIRREGYKGNIRLDTNGQVKCWYDRIVFGCVELVELNPARELKNAGLNEIRISLNATEAWDYYELCRPNPELNERIGYKNDARGVDNVFDKVCQFIKNCINEGIKTCVSFVVKFKDEDLGLGISEWLDDGSEYTKFAKGLGVKEKNIILRDYVCPAQQSAHGIP